jgi:2,3-bisphosphoglycerate-dependent phosphoglycerate mutase
MQKIVLVRHGQSKWNLENKFTGWKDIDLTADGIKEAMNAGKLIKKQNIVFNIAFTSVLKRAIKTMWYILEQNDLMWIPVHKTFRLNERHYGGLTGLNKEETANIHGIDQVQKWRRSYKTRPPESTNEFDLSLKANKKYDEINSLPRSESLEDTVIRIQPFIEHSLIKNLNNNNNIIIAAHGNSIRALLKITENISDDDISKIEIPTGKPILINYDQKNKKFDKHKYLK